MEKNISKEIISDKVVKTSETTNVEVSSEFIDNSNVNFFNILWLFFRKYLTSVSTLYIFLICTILPLFICLIFPPFFTIPPALSFNFIIGSFLVYGIYFYNIRNSTLYNNFSISRKYRIYIYISILLLILFSNLLILIYTMAFNFIFFSLDVIWSIFPFPIGVPAFKGQEFLSINFSGDTINWPIIFYGYIMITFIAFAISYFIQVNSKNVKGFFVITSGITLLNIVLGGTLSFVFSPILDGTKFSYTDLNTQNIYNLFYINTDSTYLSIEQTDAGNYLIQISPSQANINTRVINTDQGPVSVIDYEFANFGGIDVKSFLWICCQLFPFYHINQMFFAAVYGEINVLPYQLNYVPPTGAIDFPPFTNILVVADIDGVPTILNDGNQSVEVVFNALKVNNIGWLLVIIFPYIYVLFYWLLGYIVIKSKR